MSVRELLATHTALELREWIAYEQHAGPLGSQWDRRMLADVQYLAQWNNYLLGAFTTGEGKKNPIPEPQLHEIPWLRIGEENEEEDDEEE